MVLQKCTDAIAAGDGRDLFTFQSGGQLLNVAGGKCAGFGGADISDGASLTFGDCGAAPQWEVLGSGQLKVKGAGDLCLSQSGLAPGTADVAANAAVSASSTSNSIAHGALHLSCAHADHSFSVLA